jgi:hypothetical protein
MEIKRKHRGSYTVTMPEPLAPDGVCVVATIMRVWVPAQCRVMWRLESGHTWLFEPTLARAKALARDVLAGGSLGERSS